MTKIVNEYIKMQRTKNRSLWDTQKNFGRWQETCLQCTQM